MTNSICDLVPEITSSSIWQRINVLLDRYLTFEHLYDRLQDLPHQFNQPQPRSWNAIDWHAIHPSQIVGIELEVFRSILVGAINTEAPIRGYTQASRQYLEMLHPQMAQFVGGRVDSANRLIEPGLWEKEERQHTPALLKIYAQLTGEKFSPTPHEARPHTPSDDPRSSLYRHGMHRIATEYGATCLHLWLMAYTTGPLQAVLAELTIDEINHMTKFWGFGVWAFPETSPIYITRTLATTSQGQISYSHNRSSLIGTLHRMTEVLNWKAWSWHNRTTFAYVSMRVLMRLWKWNNTLTRNYLDLVFEPNL